MVSRKRLLFFIAYSNDKPVGYIFGWKEYILKLIEILMLDTFGLLY